jgi:lipopolysaccharide/colanic/teichoic acid biosynthesis glycosyltransferase
MEVMTVDGSFAGSDGSVGTLALDGFATGGNGVAAGHGSEVTRQIADALSTLAATFYPRPALSIATRPHWWRRFVDRTVDIVVATFLLLVSLPVLLVLMLVVRLSSQGSPIYRQVRVGRNGNLFHCFKLRTMLIDAEERLAELLASDRALREEFESTYKLRNDPRITSVGRFMRYTSLDELPQLVNVLRGQMSLVGPRPLVPEETVRYGDAISTVLRVRPGLTGVWQVSGRSNLPYEQRVQIDVDYATDHGVFANIWVMAKTVKVIVRPHSGGGF